LLGKPLIHGLAVCRVLSMMTRENKAIISFNINYNKMEESTISLWRPSYTQEQGEELNMLDMQQEIRYEVSAPSPLLINYLRISAELQSPFKLRMEYM
jgi:hypothetical protein